MVTVTAPSVDRFDDVQLLDFEDAGSVKRRSIDTCAVVLENKFNVLFIDNTGGEQGRLHVKDVSLCKLSASCVAVNGANDAKSFILKFAQDSDARLFLDMVNQAKETSSSRSVFDSRTEEASASQYFQFYGYLSQQQNMMQDYVRTFTYQRAMLVNQSDFKDKIVLDVGAGSGILSFFAVQAGAKHVYAVEASSMAQHCQSLVKSNRLDQKITVICGKIEEVTVPEKVDLIVSEPMGYMLVNERMLESFLHAKKFLKPGGKMYPTRGDLHIAPFTDEALFLEQCGKAAFWSQESFHGVDVSSLRSQALAEYLRQPVVDTFDPRICLAPPLPYRIDFATMAESDLHTIKIPLSFTLQTTGFIHGLAFWFDVAFIGGEQTVWLSTSPTEPLTHWYQVRCLLTQPLLGRQGQQCTGMLVLTANSRQSYDVEMELTCNGTTNKNTLDLKNPLFRYTGQPVSPPAQSQSPTDAYWGAMSATAEAVETGSMPQAVNGGLLTDNSMDHSDSRYGTPLYGGQATNQIRTGGLPAGDGHMTGTRMINQSSQNPHHRLAISPAQTGGVLQQAGYGYPVVASATAASRQPQPPTTLVSTGGWGNIAAGAVYHRAWDQGSGGSRAPTMSSWSTQQHWAAGAPPSMHPEGYVVVRGRNPAQRSMEHH